MCVYVYKDVWQWHTDTTRLFVIYHSMTTGGPKCIHLTKTESQVIYAALQSSDVNEIARALNEQQVTIVIIIT